jgi:hypothetical protein
MQGSHIARKVLVAVVFALLVLVSLHKALADNIGRLADNMGTLVGVNPKSRDKLVVTCGDLPIQVNAFAAELIVDGEVLSKFSTAAAATYTVWSQRLTPFEDLAHDWPKNYFAPIASSVKVLDDTGNEVSSWADIYSQKLDQFQGALKSCLADGPARKKQLEALAGFENELNDELNAASGFISGGLVSSMKDDLSACSQTWHRLEGQSIRVPRGYFQSLVKGADEFGEASGLYHDNAQLLSNHFKAVFAPNIELNLDRRLTVMP